jgi:CheY-like chemotaxis protein
VEDFGECDGAVLDFMLPGGQQIELSREARRRRIATPILVLTAWAMWQRRILRSIAVAASIGVTTTHVATAQRAPDDTNKTFFIRRDLVLSGIALAGTGVLSVFDKRIAHWTQTASVQGSSSRHRVVDDLTKINETTITGAAILSYGIGRLSHSGTMADVSLHTAEATILTSLISQTIRGPLGRERPVVSPDDQYKFDFGKGFTEFNNRSFPSLHSAVGFAAATAISTEIHERNPDASWWVTPVTYTVAMMPGLTRMYLNEHWASDVAAGAFVGGLIGARVVRYAHTHSRNKLDRALLGTTVASDGRGGLAIRLALDY